jgi:type IV secretory pathway TrbF-like protein
VVKQVDKTEVRVFVAAVFAFTADAVLVAQQVLKLGAHLITAMASLQVYNLARRSSLEAGNKREKKGGEERRNVINSVWQFGTGNRNCRWRARVYPEREF